MSNINVNSLKNSAHYQTIVADYFSDQSPLKTLLPGFTARQGQLDLALAIAKTIEGTDYLIAEAATGTGKTLAYLIPTLLSKKQALISTGTKTLQDQLFYKDLPLVQKSLTKPIKIALLKGRQNYICKYYLERNESHVTFSNPELSTAFQAIVKGHARTQFGELSEIKNIPEHEALRSAVTSSKENCLGQECEFFNDCYVVKARKRALEADLVVINHHLLFADYGLKEEGVGELLPQVDVIVIDEAHQILEVATRFYGKNLSSRQLLDLADDILLAQSVSAKDMGDLADLAKVLQQRVKGLRLTMGEGANKGTWQSLLKAAGVKTASEEVTEILLALKKPLEEAAGRSKELENCCERLKQVAETFETLTVAQAGDQIHWYETYTHSFMIHHSPLDIAKPFQQTLQELKAKCIFTSATLTVKNQFDYFQKALGLEAADTIQIKSPFDFKQQTLLFNPRGIPDPKHPTYQEEVILAAMPVITAAKGRTFFLFTSYQALNYAARILAEQLDFPLFVQGTQAKDYLLSQFIASGNGVLLATTSFWEGVDVRGSALSCVIIDKLPFSAPNDPIHQARCEHLKKQGKNAFFEYLIPQAIIMLKQGVGRLIRDEKDKGILMICDPRLKGRQYGTIFLESLAEYPRTREVSKVEAFLENLS